MDWQWVLKKSCINKWFQAIQDINNQGKMKRVINNPEEVV